MDRLRLGVNIDHVATIRNARGGRHPDPVRAAKLAIAAGCDGITAHLREDRRHIRDDDIARLKAEIDKPLNFEMAATDEMIGIALRTKPHGRHLGLVRGGSGSRLKPVLQPGNCVSATWRARLDEHLGNYSVEALNLRAAGFFSVPHAIYGIGHLAALMRLLPERDPHLALYESLDAIFGRLDDATSAAPMVVQFELQLLSEIGFGLDLERCVATGVSGDLVYVSPKSGRAVSRLAGEP